jgi:glycosyltransferase involved in cell wall biosynthesis
VSHCGVRRPSVAPNVQKTRPQRLVYVGRIEAYKRVDMVLHTAALLASRFPELEVTIIGRGDALPKLKQLAQELGIANRTHFTGFVSDRKRDAILSESRVCICASEKEGWGLTVIEANSSGVPVVATDTDGLRDSVRDGETGFLIPRGDVKGFAERAGALLSDDALARRMSRSALAWSREFDWERSTDDMEEAVEDALARGHVGGAIADPR